MSYARVYDQPGPGDGYRVLVDRIWPRGVAKADLDLGEWLREVAPTTELRRWYGHRPERFAQFADRYRRELDGSSALSRLLELAREHPHLTLLTATKDAAHSQAAVLVDVVRSRLAEG